MKELLRMNMIQKYNEKAFTHNYIFGYVDKKNVYVSFTDEKVLPYLLKLDKASRNGGFSLRFKPNREQKELLKVQKTFILCSRKYFEECCKRSNYNKGEVFEKLIFKHYKREWKKDITPFYKDGDITIRKKAYQIKFEKATFCTEKQVL